MNDQLLTKIFISFFLGLCFVAAMYFNERDLAFLIAGILAGFLGVSPAAQKAQIYFFRKSTDTNFSTKK